MSEFFILTHYRTGRKKNPQFNFKSTSNRLISKENGSSWRQGLMG